MTKKRRSNFRGKASENARQQKRGRTYGYLNMPKGLQLMEIEEDTRVVYFDFLPYEVTDKKHPDRNEQYEFAREGDLWYKRPFAMHRNVGVDNDVVVCPTSVGKKCPICEYRTQQLDKGVDWKELTDIKASRRNLYIVIDTEDKNEEIKVWDMSQRNFQDVLNEELEIDESNDIFPDLEEGKTAVIKLRWDSLGRNVYPVARDIAFEKRKPYDEKILDEVPNLDELLIVPTYEELKNKFYELDAEAETEAEERDDDTPTRRRRGGGDEEEEEQESKTTTRRRRPAGEEEESEPEKEKDEKTTRTRRRKDEDEDENKCPYKHTFGKDWDDTDDCSKCAQENDGKTWNACGDAYDNLKKK